MGKLEESEFFRIKEIPTGKYFNGGRTGIYCNEKGLRYEKMQPVTAALRHIANERRLAVEFVKAWPESDNVAYWQSIAERLDPANFEVIRYKEVITVVETINTKSNATIL